ncbi:MAG: hypothetical protein IJT12_08935 [Paludibacteraceae bacterium]|nr:hypothetical protein [Paludibacteraceae bacterium]
MTSTDWGNNGITASLNGCTELSGVDLGTIKTLTLCGGQMTAWANENDYYEDNSFRVAYRVYKQGETAPEEWETLSLDELTYRQDNNYRYEATDKTIDLRAMTDGRGGTWVFEAKMLGHKYWNNGSSSDSWDTNHDPESATFTLPGTYYITGAGGNDANGNWCDGKNWTSATDVTMSSSSHTFYNVAAGTYGCKVTSGSWGANNEFGYAEIDIEASDANIWSKENNNISIITDAPSDITIHFNACTGKVSVTSTLGRFVRLPYSVVGDPVLGVNWEPTNTATEMTRLDDGTYQYTLRDQELTAGSGKQFKIVGGHAWSTYQAPASGDFTVDIPENGTYDLIFDFNPTTDLATCSLMLHHDVSISAYGYSTFYSDRAYIVPEGLTATIFTGVSGEALTGESITIIPANTGVVLQGTPNATYTLLQTTTSDSYPANLLQGTVSATVISNSYVHYILGVNSGNCGLYWPNGTTEGVGSFTNGTGKAYLELSPAAAPARVRGFVLSGTNTATAVENISSDTPDVYYDILGRKVVEPKQGNIYIRNGKKTVLF